MNLSGPYFLPSWRKALCLFMLGFCLLPCAAFAEHYSATALIVDNDVDRARNEAIRDVLWEAGARSHLEVKTSAALVQGDASEVAVFNAMFRLKHFAITREEIVGNRLRIEVSLERMDADAGACNHPAPLRMVAYEWRGLTNPGSGDDARMMGGQMVGDALHERLNETLAAYLLPQLPSAKPLYRIAASMQRSGKGGWFSPWGALRLRITGDDGSIVREDELPIDSGDFAIRVTQNLGYATLKKWILTDATEELLNRASALLTQQVKCLPVVAKIPPLNADGSFSLQTEFASTLADRSMFLFSNTWPLQRGGVLDMMTIEGIVRPRLASHDTLEFPAQKKLPGRKYPIAGGYLVIQ